MNNQNSNNIVNQVNNSTLQSQLNFLAIGLIAALDIGEIRYTLGSIIKQILIYSEVIGVGNYIVTEILKIAITVIISWLVLRNVKNRLKLNTFNFKREMVVLVIVYVGILLIAFCIPFIADFLWRSEVFVNSMQEHYEIIKENIMLQTIIGTITPVINYGVIIWMITRDDWS